MKKILIILFTLVSIGLISGCSNGVKTVNDLKKELSPIKSEYEKCIAEAQAYQEKFDKELSDCKKMSDGIVCVGSSECDDFLFSNQPFPVDKQFCKICEDTKRYNDEVNKNNECGEKIKWDSSQLSQMDCTKLLTQ